MAYCRRAVPGLRTLAMDVPARCPELELHPGTVRLWLAGYLDAAADRIDVRLVGKILASGCGNA
jgi:hypothetical protein